MKYILLVSLILFIGSCNSNRLGNREASSVDSTNSTSVIEAYAQVAEIEKVEEWNFIINPPRMGLISTEYRISEIPNLLPPYFSMEKDSRLFGTDEIYDRTVFYAIRKNDKTIFEIFPQIDDSERIFSIVVLSSDYVIADTELRVGSTLKTLKETFSIRDTFFEISDGLFVLCYGFNGAFEIDLEEKGDEFEVVELLCGSKKIKAIVIY